MSEAQQRGLLTYEQAHAMEPVGYIYTCQTVQNNLAPVMMDHIALGNPEAKLGTVPVYRGEVVDTLKAQIRDLQEQLENYKRALANRDEQIVLERSRLFPAPGWFLPKDKLSDAAANSLDHLIHRAKGEARVDIITSPGSSYAVNYEADWVKYMTPVVVENIKRDHKAATLFDAIAHGDDAHRSWLREAIEAHFDGRPVPEVVMKKAVADDMTWVVKLGSAIAKLDEPILINRLRIADLDEKYQRLMQRCGHPQSHSVLEAMKQLVNEITYGSISLLEVVQKVANGDAPKELANQSGCVDPKNCCTRNRPLSEQSTCTRVVNASKDQIKVHTDLGMPDASSVSKAEEFTCAECPHQAVLEGCCGRNTKEYSQQPMDDKTLARHIEAGCDVLRKELGLPEKPIYSVAALTDPTTIQKAVIMGLVGTEKQQEEAREFLTQHIQLVKDYPATMSMAMQRQ